MSDKHEKLIALKDVIEFDKKQSVSKVVKMLQTIYKEKLYFKYAIKDHSDLVQKFPNFIKENIKKITKFEEQNTGQEEHITLNQITDALNHIKCIQEQKWIDVDPPKRWHSIFASKKSSIFQILINIYKAIKVQMPTIILFCDEEKQYIGDLFAELFELLNKEDLLNDFISLPVTYCTQIIFDSADVASAFNHLELALEHKSCEWQIRSCLVQESLRDKLMARFKGKNGFIIGNVEKYLNSNEDCVNVDFFRTAKEGINLINADGQAQFASIWTENISIALEVANKVTAANIWINSNGIFDPDVPFLFDNDIIGSELSLLQTYAGQSKIDASAQEKDDYNSVLTELYSMGKTINNKTFIVLSKKREKTDRQIFAVLLNSLPNDKQKNLLANLAENELKTICISYGSIFAN